MNSTVEKAPAGLVYHNKGEEIVWVTIEYLAASCGADVRAAAEENPDRRENDGMIPVSAWQLGLSTEEQERSTAGYSACSY